MSLKLADINDCATWELALAEYLDGHVHTTLECATEENYRAILTQFARWAVEREIELSDFKPRHMRAFVAWRQDSCKVKQTTIRADVFRAKAFFRFCVRDGLMPRDPLADYEIPRGEQPFVPTPSTADIAKLFASIPQRFDPELNPAVRNVCRRRRDFYAARNAALLSILVDTGCRIGEAVRLVDQDLRVERTELGRARGTLAIRRTKTDRPRTVPLRDSIKAVEAWTRVRDRRLRWLKDQSVKAMFVTWDGAPMSTRACGDILEDQLKYAGLPHYTLHSLRHYGITEIAKQNLEAARIIAGHTSISTTQAYLNMDADAVREAHAGASPLGKALMINRRSEANKKRR
ncbi:MAG: tyrosine-type recombinase/integrase [Patescibacteria group bacterium]|nr:tyrosine-type recombinase/integrase [Patescibacteria group bacterium]